MSSPEPAYAQRVDTQRPEATWYVRTSAASGDSPGMEDRRDSLSSCRFCLRVCPPLDLRHMCLVRNQRRVKFCFIVLRACLLKLMVLPGLLLATVVFLQTSQNLVVLCSEFTGAKPLLLALERGAVRHVLVFRKGLLAE